MHRETHALPRRAAAAGGLPWPDARTAPPAMPPGYGPPRLRVFGDVARLTAKVGSSGKKDGSGSRRTGY